VITKLPQEYFDAQSDKLSTAKNIYLRSRFDLVLVGKGGEDDLVFDTNHLPYVGNRTSTLRAESQISPLVPLPLCHPSITLTGPQHIAARRLTDAEGFVVVVVVVPTLEASFGVWGVPWGAWIERP